MSGEPWNIVRMPSPFCSWSVARPERPLSDKTRDTLQLDLLQIEGQDDCTCATEQDGGDVSGSYKGKRCKKKSDAITEKIHWHGFNFDLHMQTKHKRLQYKSIVQMDYIKFSSNSP